MGLRLKFNLVLLAVFGLGLLASGYLSYTLLERNARDEVTRNAGLMMEAALAIRSYTIEQIRPHLELQLLRVFLPQSVPAYAASETMNTLRRKYADYGYKEATINPTNPRNRATGKMTSFGSSGTGPTPPRSSASGTRPPAARSTSRGRSRSRTPRA